MFFEKPTVKSLEQILNQDHPRGQAGHIRILWMSLMTFHHLSWMNWKKYGQSIEITSEGQARLKGSERQEKERREKERLDTEMIGKVSRKEYERYQGD